MVLSQSPQNPQVPIEEGVESNIEIRLDIHRLTQVLVTQVSMDARVKVNPNTNSKVIEDIKELFPRMNPLTFYNSL